MNDEVGGESQPTLIPKPGLFSGQRKLFFAIALLVVALGYFAFNAFQGAAMFYFTVDELLSSQVEAGEAVRVNGSLVPASYQREPQGTVVRFSLTDGENLLPAIYDGIVPELFFNEQSQIVLEGYYGSDGVFHAVTTPIVKCPSKYQAQAS